MQWYSNIRVNNNGDRSHLAPEIIMDANGNYFIVWGEERKNAKVVEIYAQVVNTNGIQQWAGDTQINLYDMDVSRPLFSRPAIASNGNGTIGVTWDDYNDIYAQFLNSDGSHQWNNDIRVNINNMRNQTDSAAVMDNEGNLYVVWQDLRNDTFNVYIQKLNSDGQVWASDKLVSANGFLTKTQATPSIAFDEINNNLFVTWRDYRNNTYYNVFAQKLDLDGNLLWEEDIRINSDSSTVHDYTPSIAIVGSDAYIAWYTSYNQVYLQRITGDGINWNNDVLLGIGQNPDIYTDISGNIYVVWQKRENDQWDLFIQKLDSIGNSLWTTPVKVNNDNGLTDQINPRITVDDNDDILIVWEDYRLGHANIYIQKLNPTNGSKLWSKDILINSPTVYFETSDAYSQVVDETDGNIGWATLYTSEMIPDGGGITYLFSNNGGDQWEVAIPGTQLSFATAGSDLRWAAVLESGSEQTETPTIDWIQIDYSAEPIPPEPLTDVVVDGVAGGIVQLTYPFTATVTPQNATQPVTYTWSITDQTQIVHTGSLNDAVVLSWNTTGLKTITVSADNGVGVPVTTTHTVNITDAPHITGYARSIPIAPAEITSWNSFQLEANIPAGTSMHATILNAAMDPVMNLSDISLVDGETSIDLSNVDPAVFPSLRLRLDLTSNVPGVSPELTNWQFNWEPSPDRTYQVAGQVFDGHNNPMRGVNVTLLRAGTPIAETTTNGQGRYTITRLTPQPDEMYQVRVSLRQGIGADSAFRVFYAANRTLNESDIVYLQTLPFAFANSNSMFSTHIADFDFSYNQTDYQSNIQPQSAKSRLDDLAAIYNHVEQAVSFISGDGENELGVTLSPLKVYAYANITSNAYYDPEHDAIVMSEAFSGYRNGSRPMNREWHEIFHALMADTIGISDADCEPNTNHGGWENCSTSDSWAEGWAEFWSAVLWDQNGWPRPHLYRLGNAYVHGLIPLEFDWQVWDRPCEQQWCPSREEFAVAGLLWDLYDPVEGVPTLDDYVFVPLPELWNILGQSSDAAPLRDMKDVYDRLKDAEIGAEDSNLDECNLTDLDELFVNHGFYYDANYAGYGTHIYDCGEEVGRAADNGRPGRHNAPMVDAYLLVNVGNSLITSNALNTNAATTPITLTISMAFAELPELPVSYDFAYDVTLEQMRDNLIYLEPPPSRVPVTVTISAQAPGIESSNPLVINNTDYWNLVTASSPGTPVLVHEFEMDTVPTQIFLPLVIRD